eukprot:2466746-Amphidinium_carterae.1
MFPGLSQEVAYVKSHLEGRCQEMGSCWDAFGNGICITYYALKFVVIAWPCEGKVVRPARPIPSLSIAAPGVPSPG